MRDQDETRDRIVAAVSAHVVFDGWSLKSLKAAALEAGLDAGAGTRAFPGGITEAIAHYFDWGDRRMLEALAAREMTTLNVRERLIAGVETRLALFENREVVRRALAVLAVPTHATTGLKITWRTVDALWHGAGDTATDFSFYTKRTLLAGLYTATLLYWLNDDSENGEDTRSFLTRRMVGMTTWRHSLERKLSVLPDPRRLFRWSR
ncbi:MAG: rpsU-divergently transcribed protein [Rhodospirillaceae bacterium]|nr:MAG: rpsU-divergently transcribed protein [Rhodospirillaceae bacterium]